MDLKDEELIFQAASGDVRAMQELARRGNEEYRRAFREACIDVLGEDPEEDWA